MDGITWRIGELARESGLSVRTLHYYDSIGLVQPFGHTAGGHRIYSTADFNRLYAVAVLRRTGMPISQIAQKLSGASWDLLSIAQMQCHALDVELASLGALRHRLATVLDGDVRTPAELIKAMQGIPVTSGTVGRALALLPYDDVLDAQTRLIQMFGFEAGLVSHNSDGTVAYAAVIAGSGVVHLHPPTAEVRSPGQDGIGSAIVVATVADVDQHATRAAEFGARITYGPRDTNYGAREYGARDHEGHHWSFQSPLLKEKK